MARAVGRYEDASESELMRLAATGDSAAFGELVRRNMHRGYRAALGLVGSHDDAMDLSQDAFARALNHAARMDPDRPFYPWFYQILRRLCFNFLRDRANRKRLLDEAGGWIGTDPIVGGSPEHPDVRLSREDARRIVVRAVARLPEVQREVLVLREFEGLKYAEIADLLEIPAGTVMSRLYAARRGLAEALEEHD
ncbi:MAG: sigma-70 family RNA polymerase sigma factor [Gemmatimonadota bacterium]|nr:sigma-70 family RNA polymerase sigma factor [Gemmatimonadota bacterium]